MSKRSRLIVYQLGSPEGQSPFAGGLGVSPNFFKIPQAYRIKGFEKRLVNIFGKPSQLQEMFGNWGVQRGLTPLPGHWGCPPIS